MNHSLSASLQQMVQEHQLPPGYLDSALKWFAPLAKVIAAHQKGAGRPILVGINGSQGSGKTTACDYLRRRLETEHGLSVVTMSLDDFYLTRDERSELARSVHPLLQTRGVPGTHDLSLLSATVTALLAGERPFIPRFDKARDDRAPETDWRAPTSMVDVVLLEGWCLGVPPETDDALAEPLNALEFEEDADGRWRRYVNDRLARDYVPLYRDVDFWAMLKAPSFACVYRWRLEQEEKLAAAVAAREGDASQVMSEAEVARFIQFYQRLTEHGLAALPERMHCTLCLDDQRRVERTVWSEESQAI